MVERSWLATPEEEYREGLHIPPDVPIKYSFPRWSLARPWKAVEFLKERRADEWTDDEIILAIDTCPRDKQSYSPRHRNVIELADLIGRSRPAVSHRFANISHLIFGEGHGESHVSAGTRKLFEEYKGREKELHARAAEIRQRLMRDSLTPRAEVQAPKERAKQLTLEVFDAARSAGLPEDIIKTYEREGSWFFGFLVQLSQVLVQYPSQVADFLGQAVELLGDNATRSEGLDLVREGHLQDLAERILAKDAPELDLKEIEPKDRVTLALRIREFGTLKSWKPRPTHLPVVMNMNGAAERRRVGEYLGIRADKLSDRSLLMLKDLVDKSLKGK